MRIGVDTGGTFTDFVAWDGKRLHTRKIRSSPDDPSRAVLSGLHPAFSKEEPLRSVVHGSTVATNALLERRGARLGFIATAGFEDILSLGRQARPALYDWFAPPPEPLAPRELCFGVGERTLVGGSIEQPLAEADVRAAAAKLTDSGVESVAVCLLHSYANPAHERRIGEILREAGLFVSLSHEVLPEYREYERAATTAVNAYVSPLMGRYLERLAGALGPQAEQGPGDGVRLSVFGSNGGSMSAAAAGRRAVDTVLSGPAGGVQGAIAVAEAAGFERIISFDMGGTSTDVSLYDGGPRFTSEASLGGCPIRVSMLDIETVGAGGGSIAYLDSGDALRVGPRSAGAEPGPACYGSGDEFTVTDANLILGRIDPARFLGGAMQLDVDRAHRIAEAFARKAGVTRERAARAVVDVANSNMERAVRKVSVERGIDPREFALLCFGGAGAQHACELAERLEMRTVVVPQQAGVLSALGMLTADFVRDYSRSGFDSDPEAAYKDLEKCAAEELEAEGFEQIRLERAVDLRYRGQSFEITVPWGDRGEFDRAHERRYGYAHQGREVQTVTLRLKAIGVSQQEPIDLAAPAEAEAFSSLHIPPGWNRSDDAIGNAVLRRTA